MIHSRPFQINHRLARAASGATVALSALWAGFAVFGPISDARALHLAQATLIAAADGANASGREPAEPRASQDAGHADPSVTLRR